MVEVSLSATNNSIFAAAIVAFFSIANCYFAFPLHVDLPLQHSYPQRENSERCSRGSNGNFVRGNTVEPGCKDSFK